MAGDVQLILTDKTNIAGSAKTTAGAHARKLARKAFILFKEFEQEWQSSSTVQKER